MCSMSTLSNKRQLEQAVRQVEQIHRFQAQAHQLTSKCWDLCMDKPGTRLGSNTETCLTNCVGRFIDTTNFVANRLEKVMVNQHTASAFD